MQLSKIPSFLAFPSSLLPLPSVSTLPRRAGATTGTTSMALSLLPPHGAGARIVDASAGASSWRCGRPLIRFSSSGAPPALPGRSYENLDLGHGLLEGEGQS
uniref:Uncharacterized protein n=1 Tax=Setaria italica TaxID=4555 RepID=K3YKE7_SETIT